MSSAPNPDNNKSNIADYLDNNIKNKKEYILMALGKNIDSTTKASMIKICKQKFQNQTLLVAEKKEDMQKFVAKQITHSIIDDEITDWGFLEKYIKILKKKSKANGAPVIFLTRNPDELIKKYHDKLFTYQENDQYIAVQVDNKSAIVNELRSRIELKNNRRSRRFPINHDIFFRSINRTEDWEPAKIIDISMHGLKIKTQVENVLAVNDQIQVSINIRQYPIDSESEFLKMSASVKRMELGAMRASAEWRFMTDRQYLHLNSFIFHLSNEFDKKRLRQFFMKNEKYRKL